MPSKGKGSSTRTAAICSLTQRWARLRRARFSVHLE
jgi:hypothetical protein